jgi:alcohol dehydrogenase YqhD (iron-dependent ADH family)
LKTWCKFAYGFEFVAIFKFDHFSALLLTAPTIFSAVTATTRKNIRELKLQPFSALLLTKRENDRRCRQQLGTFFRAVGNNADKLPQRRTV